MKTNMLRLTMLSVVATFFAGCDPEIPMTSALDKSAWEKSIWISASDATPVTDEIARTARSADGISWFVLEDVEANEVKSVKWMTTGLGVYEIYLNGKRVGSETLKPGFTHAYKTRRSFTYDVTPLYKNGEANFFAAEVSSGWWCDQVCGFRGKLPAFRSVIEFTFTDGSTKLVGTDTKSWKAGVTGPITHAAIFDGEEYDARIEAPYFGSAALKTPIVNDEFKGEILPSEGAEIYRRWDKALKPIEIYVWRGVKGAKKATETEPEVFGTVRKLRSYVVDEEVMLDKGETLIVDFGQNCAGVPGFLFKADEGTVLTCLPVEMLNDGNGERSRGNDGPAGSAYRENLRVPDIGMRAIYTFGKPNADGEYSYYFPTHTFFGYRYISVTATDKVYLKAIASIPVTSIAAKLELGSMETGVDDVNKLISNVYWGQLSNYLSVPTDCPQRNERLGWTADTQVFCEAGSFNADTSHFLEKWMRDMVDSRDDDGGFPSVAPLAQYGNETFSLGWADAGVIVPWTIWKQFGDKKIITENYDAMAKFVRKLDETKYKYDDKHYTYADWLSYETFETCGNQYGSWWNWQKDPDAINYREYLAACYWYYDAIMMVEIASALNKNDDVVSFKGVAERAMNYIRATYLESDGLLLKPMRHLQTGCIFALKFGVVEGEAREETKKLLLKSIREHGDRLQTGFLGTGFIMDTLTEIGAVDVAYTLLLQHENPSWLYSVDQGATTIWERWNSYVKETGFGPVGMNSFNHYAYGAVLAWMYKTAAGIAATTDDPGFKTIIMAPRPDCRLGHIKAEYNSAAGLIKSAWRYDGDKWIWEFTIPEGAKAIVRLDGEKDVVYTAGDYTITREAK